MTRIESSATHPHEGGRGTKPLLKKIALGVSPAIPLALSACTNNGQTPAPTESAPTILPTQAAPTEAPTTAPTATLEPTTAPTRVPEVVAPNVVDYANSQSLIDADYGYRYQLSGQALTALDGIPLEPANEGQWVINAENNAQLVAERTGTVPDTTLVFTNGKKDGDSRNAAMSFSGNAIMWPSLPNGSSTFLSSSPSEYWFSVETDQSKVGYEKVTLPEGYTANDVRMGWVGDHQTVELSAKAGKGMMVFNPTTHEWTTMKDRPNSELLMKAVAPYAESEGLDSTAVLERMRNVDALSYTAQDGTPFKVLVDPQTQTPLAIEIKNSRGEMEWKVAHMKDIVNIPGGIETVGSETRMFSGFFDELNQGTIGATWSVLEPQQGVYDFSNFDAEVQQLQANGSDIRAQSIVFGSQDWTMPQWLLEGNYSNEEIKKIMTDHIAAVVNHGKAMGVREWVIVNEPYKAGGNRKMDIFYQAYGGYDYIDAAYEAARKADPGAILIFNDTYNHAAGGETTALTHQIVDRLRSKTVVCDDGIARPLLDAVGVQSHLGDWVPLSDPADVAATLRSYGLPVIITEFDVDVSRMPGNEAEKRSQQAKAYADYLRAVINSGVVKDVTFWGLVDSNNWRTTDQGVREAAPALFDFDNKPKIAYYEVLKVLLEDALSHSTMAQ